MLNLLLSCVYHFISVCIKKTLECDETMIMKLIYLLMVLMTSFFNIGIFSFISTLPIVIIYILNNMNSISTLIESRLENFLNSDLKICKLFKTYCSCDCNDIITSNLINCLFAFHLSIKSIILLLNFSIFNGISGFILAYTILPNQNMTQSAKITWLLVHGFWSINYSMISYYDSFYLSIGTLMLCSYLCYDNVVENYINEYCAINYYMLICINLYPTITDSISFSFDYGIINALMSLYLLYAVSFGTKSSLFNNIILKTLNDNKKKILNKLDKKINLNNIKPLNEINNGGTDKIVTFEINNNTNKQKKKQIKIEKIENKQNEVTLNDYLKYI